MMRIHCEVCGGKDILKDKGVFICQSCGCQYSLEEVRKMVAGDAPAAQPEALTASADPAEEYRNMLAATRDAMADGRFDSAYANSVYLIAMKPDVPEFVAIQALASMGQERLSLDIPASALKGMERFHTMFETWNAENAEKTAAVKNVQGYLGVACNAQYALIRDAITELEGLKYTASPTDELEALGDTLGMLSGDLYSTVHGIGRERDGRQKDEDNQIVDSRIGRIKEKAQKIDEFRMDQLKRLAMLYKKCVDGVSLEKGDPDLPENQEELQKWIGELCPDGEMRAEHGIRYIRLDDENIKCFKCGKVQSVYRMKLGCRQCGASFT